MDHIGYSGWIQIEGAVPPGKSILKSYKLNCAFMRDVFGA